MAVDVAGTARSPEWAAAMAVTSSGKRVTPPSGASSSSQAVPSPSAQLRTAPLGLALFQGQYAQGTALLAAGAVLVALPVVVVYLVPQRHVIRGMVEGAVRG